MTAEEIRAISEAINKVPECEPLHQANPTIGYSTAQFVVLREIAAQLAEHTALLREESERRRVQYEENQITQTKQQEMMASLANASAKMMAPASPPPRIEFPGTVTHLGCIIREPDGAYKIATNQGDLLELAETDFQRIFAPPIPTEVKPS